MKIDRRDFCLTAAASALLAAQPGSQVAAAPEVMDIACGFIVMKNQDGSFVVMNGEERMELLAKGTLSFANFINHEAGNMRLLHEVHRSANGDLVDLGINMDNNELIGITYTYSLEDESGRSHTNQVVKYRVERVEDGSWE